MIQKLVEETALTPRIKSTKSLTKIFAKIPKKRITRGLKAFHRHVRRKNESHKVKGVLLLPYDYTPLDQIIHLPILCENNNLSYIFISKSELENLTGYKSTCVFVKKKKDYLDEYKNFKIENDIKN